MYMQHGITEGKQYQTKPTSFFDKIIDFLGKGSVADLICLESVGYGCQR